MPCTVNPVRVALLKKNLLAGQSQTKAMLNAGFAKSTSLARLADNKSLKIAKAEIEKDIKKQITVESVLKSIQKIKSLAIADKDYSTATRCDELCGRWLAMWRDRLEIVPVEATDGQFSVGRLARMRSIPAVGVDITASEVSKQC